MFIAAHLDEKAVGDKLDILGHFLFVHSDESTGERVANEL